MLSPDNSSDDVEEEHSPAIYDLDSDEICFLPNSQNYCVCIVDILNSTGITAKISDHQKIRQYYSIFINTMGVYYCYNSFLRFKSSTIE